MLISRLAPADDGLTHPRPALSLDGHFTSSISQMTNGEPRLARSVSSHMLGSFVQPSTSGRPAKPLSVRAPHSRFDLGVRGFHANFVRFQRTRDPLPPLRPAADKPVILPHARCGKNLGTRGLGLAVSAWTDIHAANGAQGSAAGTRCGQILSLSAQGRCVSKGCHARYASRPQIPPGFSGPT